MLAGTQGNVRSPSGRKRGATVPEPLPPHFKGSTGGSRQRRRLSCGLWLAQGWEEWCEGTLASGCELAPGLAHRCWGAARIHRSCFLQCCETGDAVRCSERQYEHKGRCCNRCQPGEKLVSECDGTEESVCTRCESGHYQQGWTKEKHCAPHDICEGNAGLVVKTEGNATHNTVCQCRAGMHCSDSSCQTCLENQPCQRGFGFVAAKAMAQLSSPCEPCAEGTFSNISSKTEPCHPWTSCEEKGLAVKVKGTNISDVICESGGRSSLSVLIPITAAVVTCLVGICIYCLVHTDPRRQMQKQIEAGNMENLERKQAVEIGEEESLPGQETLLRHQPVAQEDGKESRMAEQEGL
ncbi:tumor necrosis factor receptor superfamily member 5 isoform X2 [Melanerpes formicivorus]|uniref:tumor necrosis factor receptor superfamily member 5 isoform X2 n=1 Tax=Melanerpes formicivorus TaxID=211600 RepID=UPI0035900A50